MKHVPLHEEQDQAWMAPVDVTWQRMTPAVQALAPHTSQILAKPCSTEPKEDCV